MSGLKYLFLVCALVAMGECYKNGAPPEACSDMTPQHGVDPKELPSPYTLTATKKSNKKISVTIGSQDGTKFKGFLLKALDKDGNPIGTFDSVTNGKLTACGENNNAVTHSDNSDKRRATVNWNAPAGFSGTVQFALTTAKTATSTG